MARAGWLWMRSEGGLGGEKKRAVQRVECLHRLRASPHRGVMMRWWLIEPSGCVYIYTCKVVRLLLLLFVGQDGGKEKMGKQGCIYLIVI